MASRITVSLLSLIVLGVIWELLAGFFDSRLLPPPTTVVTAMVAETRSGELPQHLAITLLRVAAAFVLAMAIGFALGLAMGRSTLVDKVFDG